MIGGVVRRRREELGLTGAQLAARAGMAPSTVSQIETGKRSPSSASVVKLADALGVEVGDLLPKKAQAPLPLEGREEQRASAGLTVEEIRTFLEEQVGSAWIALPADEWENWWRFVPMEEATRRYQQIRAEWRAIAEEWQATYGKEGGNPTLVPRGGRWGDVYFELFARHFGAPFFAPQKNESERDFKKRQLKDRAIAGFHEELLDSTQEALRTTTEAASG